MVKLLTQIIPLQKIYMKKKRKEKEKKERTRNKKQKVGLGDEIAQWGKGGEEERDASTHQCESGLCS